MDMQHMSMDKMHTVFWRDDQITILFQSALPLIEEDGLLQKRPLMEFDATAQLNKLNHFLEGKKVPVTLHLLDESDDSDPMKPARRQRILEGVELPDGFLQLPHGVYPFGLTTPVESPYGIIRTSFISFFQIKVRSSHDGSGGMSMKVDDSDTGKFIPEIVRTFNENLKELNKGEPIQITIAAPTWLTGGTGGTGGGGQGCPLTPPIPVTDSCSNWHIDLPDLFPDDLKTRTGDGVTAFILDSFPERGAITRAAHDAGSDNVLLQEVDGTATFDYSFMSGVQDVQEIGATSGTFVGKDVYGRHYPIELADHGLFIAGIVHDVAPDTKIECIRVLDDLCVGDVQVIANALWSIYYRKALRTGDLYKKPVVVNLSLVIPTDEEANSKGVSTAFSGSTNVWSSVQQPLLSLSNLGVISVASAGNEADLRDMPGGNRPNALYPAKFGNAPYNMEGVIPVGAVDGKGQATSYSCYPGPRGIAVYGGEVPSVTPKVPPSSNPSVDITDALRGIYSSSDYPPLSIDPPAQYYAAPDARAWAYWVGTSFATPIISGLAARILEEKQTTAMPDSVRDNVLHAATLGTAWDRLNSPAGGNTTITEDGRVIYATQQCQSVDYESEAEVEVEITEISMIVNELNA